MFDPILFWNEVALEANRVNHTNGQDGDQAGPPRSARALAIVHLAMYDAYAGVINDAANLPRYLDPPASPGPGADVNAAVNAAVAFAAYRTLSKLFPSQQSFFNLALEGVGDPDPAADASKFGLAVADAILAGRKDDPLATSPGYTPKLDRGKHRVDPDNPGQGFHGADYGAKSKGFAIANRFELAKPPLDNDEYRRALRQVRGRGIAPELMGALPPDIEGRTVDQTLIGIFWAYDGAAELGTPPRFYNQIVRRIAKARNNSVAQNARLFAFVNAALADAGILAWDQKYIHEFWRPVIGIREHDRSMGPAAMTARNNISNNCDSSWLPLGAPLTNRMGKNVTPPFPAYPSGHATFGAAAFHVTRLFYGVANGDRNPDTVFTNAAANPLDIVSEELNGINKDNKGTVRPRHVRNFPDGLWQMILENGRSRVYLGVHWVFDAFVVDDDNVPNLGRKDEHGNFYGGVPLGLQIAEDIYQAGGGLAPKKSPVGPRA